MHKAIKKEKAMEKRILCRKLVEAFQTLLTIVLGAKKGMLGEVCLDKAKGGALWVTLYMP